MKKSDYIRLVNENSIKKIRVFNSNLKECENFSLTKEGYLALQKLDIFEKWFCFKCNKVFSIRDVLKIKKFTDKPFYIEKNMKLYTPDDILITHILLVGNITEWLKCV